MQSQREAPKDLAGALGAVAGMAMLLACGNIRPGTAGAQKAHCGSCISLKYCCSAPQPAVLPLGCSPSLSVICRCTAHRPSCLSSAASHPPALLLPRPHPGVLDESANTLFLTELWRGLAMTLKCFFEPPVTVSGQQSRRVGHPGRRGGLLNRPLQRGGGPASQSGCMSASPSTAHWVLMPLATLTPAPPDQLPI